MGRKENIALISEARDLAGEKDYCAAIGRLETALAAEPGNAGALEALEAIRGTLELELLSEIERLMGSAESHLSTGASETAETLATQVFRLDPGNQAALELLERSGGDDQPLGDNWDSQPLPEGAIGLDEDHVHLIERIDHLLSSAPMSAPAVTVASEATGLGMEGHRQGPNDEATEGLSEWPQTRIVCSPESSLVERAQPDESDLTKPASPQAAPATLVTDVVLTQETSQLPAMLSGGVVSESDPHRDPLCEEAREGPVTVSQELAEMPPPEAKAPPGVSLPAVSPPTVKPALWQRIGLSALCVIAVSLVVVNWLAKLPRPEPPQSGMTETVEKVPKLNDRHDPDVVGNPPATEEAILPELDDEVDVSLTEDHVRQEVKIFSDLPVAAGSLSVNWKPWARVRISGQEEQTTPCLFVDLPQGSYAVELSNPSFPPEFRQVVISTGQMQRLVGEFLSDGHLNVNAVPWAVVVIGGEDRGTTPLRLNLRPGIYDVVLQHPDYGEVSYSVKIESGGQEKISHPF